MALAMVLFFAATYVYYHMVQPPADASEIYVLGRQWMWETWHKEGRREINTLHVPVGRPVRLTMTSQDVIHSFYIPAFRVKQDVIPGRYTSLWFEADEAGHVPPVLRRVLRDAALGDGRQGGRDGAGRLPAVAPVGDGQGVDGRGGRAAVHAGTGATAATAGTPPSGRRCSKGSTATPCRSRRGEVVTADERYIRDSILLPRSQVVAGYDPVMPTFEGHINESDLLKIISYIKSIGNTEKVEQ